MPERFGVPWPGEEVAREVEAAGMSAFCSGEFIDHDPYVTTAQMASATTTSLIGPGIAYAFSRTPFAHASALRQLNKAAPGRLFVGVGSAAYKINRDWLSVGPDRPMARMIEFVAVLRAYLHAENGEPIRYQGEFYSVDAQVRAPVLGRLDIPVLIGAFNARMCQATGQIGDGIIGHGLYTSEWWEEVVRPALATGAESAERSPESILEHGWIITAINDEDPGRAIADARRMVGFYLTVRSYDPMVEMLGWQRQVTELREAFKRGDIAAMTSAVNDEMLAAIAVCGTTADAKATLRARGAGLPRDVAFLAPPSYLVSEARKAAYVRSSLLLING